MLEVCSERVYCVPSDVGVEWLLVLCMFSSRQVKSYGAVVGTDLGHDFACEVCADPHYAFRVEEPLPFREDDAAVSRLRCERDLRDMLNAESSNVRGLVSWHAESQVRRKGCAVVEEEAADRGVVALVGALAVVAAANVLLYQIQDLIRIVGFELPLYELSRFDAPPLRLLVEPTHEPIQVATHHRCRIRTQTTQPEAHRIRGHMTRRHNRNSGPPNPPKPARHLLTPAQLGNSRVTRNVTKTPNEVNSINRGILQELCELSVATTGRLVEKRCRFLYSRRTPFRRVPDWCGYFRLGLLAQCLISELMFWLSCRLIMAHDVADEGHMQILVPYGLYRDVLAWIRRTHRTLTVNEFIAEAAQERLCVVVQECRMRTT